MKVSIDSGVKQIRMLQDAEVLTPAAQDTVDAYADVDGSEIDAANYRTVAIVIQNTDVANDLDWKVLGSIDGTTFVEVQAEATVQQAGSGSYSTTTAVWRYYKVQVKSTVGAAVATALVHVIAK